MLRNMHGYSKFDCEITLVVYGFNGSQRGMFIASLIVIFLATYPVESEIIFLSKNCIFLKLLSQLNQRANMIF